MRRDWSVEVDEVLADVPLPVDVDDVFVWCKEHGFPALVDRAVDYEPWKWPARQARWEMEDTDRYSGTAGKVVFRPIVPGYTGEYVPEVTVGATLYSLIFLAKYPITGIVVPQALAEDVCQQITDPKYIVGLTARQMNMFTEGFGVEFEITGTYRSEDLMTAKELDWVMKRVCAGVLGYCEELDNYYRSDCEDWGW